MSQQSKPELDMDLVEKIAQTVGIPIEVLGETREVRRKRMEIAAMLTEPWPCPACGLENFADDVECRDAMCTGKRVTKSDLDDKIGERAASPRSDFIPSAEFMAQRESSLSDLAQRLSAIIPAVASGVYDRGALCTVLQRAASQVQKDRVLISHLLNIWHSYNLTNLAETESRIDAMKKLLMEADRG